jgi:hypothetical protein
METLFDIPAVEPVAVAMHPAGKLSYSLENFHALLAKHNIPLADARLHPKSAAFLATREAVMDGRCPLYVYTETHECDCEHCRCDEVTIWWDCPICGHENKEHEQLVDGFASECRQHRDRNYNTGGCGAEFEARLVDGKPRLFLVPDPERPTPRI